MAKSGTRSKNRGPYLTAALICETILEDKDGSLSAIRIVDTVSVQVPPDAPADIPSESNRLPIQVNLLLAFKTGGAPGEHALRIDVQSPSGKINKGLAEATLKLDDKPHGGINLKLHSLLVIASAGLFWVIILLDGKQVTRIPLMVILERATLPPTAPTIPLALPPANPPPV
jgi:hypothetical protein